ncbi:MAG: MFS transporter [Acetobacteraceae bacterium]
MPGFGRDTFHFLRDNARWLAGGFLLTLFSCFAQTFFVGLSGKDLRVAFHLSGGDFGGLYMLATGAGALCLPFLGRMLDLMPGWKVIRFTVPVFALACVLITVAPNVVILTLALYLLRLFGQGMMSEIAFTVIGRWFVANRGRAMALIVAGQQAGLAFLPILFVLIDRATASWRTVWIASAALVALVGMPAIIALMKIERVPRSHEAKVRNQNTARDWTRSQVIRDPVLYLLLVGILAPSFISTVIFFNEDYLIELRGYDPLAFAAAFPIMSVTTVLFSLVCGHLIDRFGSLRLLPFFLLPLAIAQAALGLITPVWGVYLFMFLFGIGSGFSSTLLGALWPEVYGLANLGGIRAIIVSAIVLSTALGPGISGALIDRGVRLPTQILWLSGWCVAGCFVLALAARQVQRREAQSRATAVCEAH